MRAAATPASHMLLWLENVIVTLSVYTVVLVRRKESYPFRSTVKVLYSCVVYYHVIRKFI